jgi:phosphate transporter
MAETYQTLLDEITAIEDRELGGDDVIKEENEDEADGSDYDGEGLNGESDVLLRRSSHSNFPNTSNANANRPLMQKRASIMHRLGAGWKSRRRGSALPTSTHEADLMEASVASLQPRRSSIEGANGRRLSQSADEAMLSPTAELPPSASPTSPARRKTSRRASMSSTSSHERDFVLPRTRWQSLELVEMDEGEVPDFARSPNAIINGNGNGNGNGDAEMGDIQEESDRPVYMWTGSNDHATVMRIGFKKRVSANWLEAYALKQYVDLNLTAFEKILKK